MPNDQGLMTGWTGCDKRELSRDHDARPLTRRRFLAASGAVLASRWAAARTNARSPNDRIQVGIIGLGSRGFNLIDEFLAEPDVQIVAVCDVHDLHYRDRPWGTGAVLGRRPAQARINKAYAAEQKRDGSAQRGVSVTADYRELCARRDIDALVVATPDHWHALCTLDALRQGKDVYCEKPVTHLFQEGVVICQEVEQQQAVFQTGSQQRSDRLFRHAVDLIRNGVIGRLHKIEVGLPPGYDVPQASTDVSEPPAGLDYELWCGPAPRLPYMRARHHRWWRGHRAYGGGVLMDWIGHHNDIAHWSLDLDQSGPLIVEAVDWTFPSTDIYDTPQHYTIRCEYDGGVTSTISDSNTLGTKWIGDDGWIHVDRGRLTASDDRWTRLEFNPGPIRVEQSPGHVRNFLDCMRSRERCLAPAETAHRSITPGHLGYISQALGRPLRWDAVKQRVIDDHEANERLTQIAYRPPWSIELTTLRPDQTVPRTQTN